MTRSSTLALRRELATLAASQAGFFTAAQAQDVGYSHQAQKYHADRGNWAKVDRGVYRLPHWPIGPHDDLVRWTLWSGGVAVVSHETALSVLDLGVANPERIDLTVPPGFGRRHLRLRLHRAQLGRQDVAEQDGYAVTTPIRTLVDVAAEPDAALDVLAGAVAEALERGLITRRGLRERADAAGPQAGLHIERALQELGG